MNKKIFAALGLSLILAIVVFLTVDRRSKEEKMLDAISWFIYQNSGEFEDYKALEFIEITNEMLLKDVQLKTQLAVVQDTLKQKAQLLHANQKLPNSWQKEVNAFEQSIQPDQMDEILKLNAKLNLAIESMEHTPQIENIQQREHAAIEMISTKLAALNLSIYGIDLSGQENLYYLHRYAIDSQHLLSVFEIDAATQSIKSFKQIG